MGIRSRITETVSNWYHGKWFPHDNPPGSSVFIVGGYVVRHWTASAASVVIGFYLEHWKWIWTTLIALVALSFTAHWLK